MSSSTEAPSISTTRRATRRRPSRISASSVSPNSISVLERATPSSSTNWRRWSMCSKSTTGRARLTRSPSCLIRAPDAGSTPLPQQSRIRREHRDQQHRLLQQSRRQLRRGLQVTDGSNFGNRSDDDAGGLLDRRNRRKCLERGQLVERPRRHEHHRTAPNGTTDVVISAQSQTGRMTWSSVRTCRSTASR